MTSQLHCIFCGSIDNSNEIINQVTYLLIAVEDKATTNYVIDFLLKFLSHILM